MGRRGGAGAVLGGRPQPGQRRCGHVGGREEARACPLERGEGELPEALAAPIWGRYGLFRGHPRITGLLMWDVPERQVLVVGQRGGQEFDELLFAPPRQPVRLSRA